MQSNIQSYFMHTKESFMQKHNFVATATSIYWIILAQVHVLHQYYSHYKFLFYISQLLNVTTKVQQQARKKNPQIKQTELDCLQRVTSEPDPVTFSWCW